MLKSIYIFSVSRMDYAMEGVNKRPTRSSKGSLSTIQSMLCSKSSDL